LLDVFNGTHVPKAVQLELK